VGLFVVACFLTALDRFLRLLWQKFYAAWNLLKQSQAASGDQMTLPGQEVNRTLVIAVAWMLIYWSLMIPIVLLELILAVECLGTILKRLQ